MNITNKLNKLQWYNTLNVWQVFGHRPLSSRIYLHNENNK